MIYDKPIILVFKQFRNIVGMKKSEGRHELSSIRTKSTSNFFQGPKRFLSIVVYLCSQNDLQTRRDEQISQLTYYQPTDTIPAPLQCHLQDYTTVITLFKSSNTTTSRRFKIMVLLIMIHCFERQRDLWRTHQYTFPTNHRQS